MVDADGRRTTDGRRLDGYTISSLCEPNGSGELIMRRMKKGLFILFDAEKHTLSYNGRAEKYTFNARTSPYTLI